ncbi:hypothetical protein [Wolbachia endosymbiont of Ctenocephalides felis wCfeT]|uniref:hypothetical protein n=1 Tax=Wolbachia endosymbiont of Ctenocephalides felis wCfeT TaxID=2732593 RepID=UPI00144806A7|nr:hypothetical protein [Wolbachia endosymbiont of Ctenocephalides felis wCfeT]
MHANGVQQNEAQSKKINEKWLVIGTGMLLFAMMLPSIFLLAKIAIGSTMISIATIAIKISSKTISSSLENNNAEQQTTQNKFINLAVGLASIFVGGISLLIIAKTGLIAACAAVTALALHEYLKDEEIGKNISTKFDKIAENSTQLIVSSIEKFLSPQVQSRET